MPDTSTAKQQPQPPADKEHLAQRTLANPRRSRRA